MKTLGLSILGAMALSSVSCQTSYDAFGNPRQSVDPGVAIAGVAAAGVLGYALSNNNRNRYRNNNYYNNGNRNGRFHNDGRNGFRRY